MATNLSDLVPKVFHPCWRSMRDFEKVEYWMVGGRGAAKSTVAALRCLNALARDPDANIAAFKKHGVEIETSVYAEFGKAITRLNWGDLFKFKTSPYQIEYRPTGQKIFFRGLDDPNKTRSFATLRGYVQVGWFEEYCQYDGQQEIDTVLQSIGRGGPLFQTIATYNPPETRAAWVNVERNKANPDRYVHESSYLDIPPEWLGPAFFSIAERIKRENPDRYRHDYLGEITGTGGEVFRNLEAREITDEEIANFRRKRWGMDFGQADPTVLVGTNYDANARTLYFFDEWGKPDAFIAEMLDAIENRGLMSTPIIGDEGGGGKGVIKELRAKGVRRIVEAYKPGGSVEKGMRWYRDLARIVIDPKRCPMTWQEFSGYEYDRLRDGTYRNEYPDRDNHRIDAGRYANEDAIFGECRSRLLI
ncbi:MAG: PBSX family phage terminase large subunit [Kiritimatiellia bacterium]